MAAMKSFLRAVALGTFAFLIAGCGSKTSPPIACTQALPLEFAYMLSSDGTAVSMFTINSCTGAFTTMTPANVSTSVGPGQQGAEDMVVDPLGRFVYAANLISNSAPNQATIAMFTVNSSTGILTPTNPPTVPTGFLPQAIAIDPAGKFVYTANSDDNTVSMFTVNPTTGVLTPTAPAAVATGRSPNFLAVHPSGKFLYVTNQNDFTVSMYTIDQNTGILSPTTPATVSSGDFGITVDPSGKFAYVVNNFFNSVTTFSVDSTTGVLMQTGNVIVGKGPTTIALDPTGKFAYVANRLDNTLSLFNVNGANGSLTPNVLATVATGSRPFRIQFDPARRFVYVVNEESPASIFSMNTNGTLNSMGMTGSSAVSLAITVGK